MNPKDEFIHDYPDNLTTPWKENWYFNFIDRKNHVWGINHISLMRHTNEGRFSCIHVVDEKKILPYSNLIEIKNLSEVSDGRLKFEFIEPFKKFRVTFNGLKHQLDLNYEATCPVYFYDKPEQSENKALSVNHYRQSLIARGTLTIGNKTRPIECHCDRDHTWGFRDEGKLTGWNWAGVYFPNRTINFHRILMGEKSFGTGYLSTPDGNVPLKRVTIENTRFESDAPVSSVFTGYDNNDKIITKIKSEKFFTLKLPMADKEGVVIFENFAEFTDLKTSEKCDGVDEYLINPAEPRNK